MEENGIHADNAPNKNSLIPPPIEVIRQPDDDAADNQNGDADSPPNSRSRKTFRERREARRHSSSRRRACDAEDPETPSAHWKDADANGTELSAEQPSEPLKSSRKPRDSSGNDRTKDRKMQLRQVQNERAILESDIADLKRENRQLSKALKKERESKKELSRLSAEKVAAAQGEVAVLRGQCKGLASRIHHAEALNETLSETSDSDTQDVASELHRLQAWVQEQNLIQESERTTNEQSREQSRMLRDSLEVERNELKVSRDIAEHRAAFVVARAEEAMLEFGSGLRVQVEALLEEILGAQNDEDCSIERLGLISKLAIAMQTKLEESSCLLEQLTAEPPTPPPGTPTSAPDSASEVVTDEVVRKWRQMRDNGMITQEEFVELSELSPCSGSHPAASSPVTPISSVEKKASKWSWRGGPNKRQEEVAAVVRLAQAQMLEELKYSLVDREEAVHELQERLYEVEAERDEALNRSQSSHGDFSQRSQRSGLHSRSCSMDSTDFGDLSQGSISPREYDEETLRLQQLNNELCACQEIYLTLPKGTERRALRVRMKELDRQCKHLQAQLNRHPSGENNSPGSATCDGMSTGGTTPTSSTPTSNEAVLESALMQAEAIAHGLELLPPISPDEKRRDNNNNNNNNSSPKGSPDKASPLSSQRREEKIQQQQLGAPTEVGYLDDILPPSNPQQRKSGSSSVPGSPTHAEPTNATAAAPTTPKGTCSSSAMSPVPKASGWNSVKNVVVTKAVPLAGMTGSRTKAGSLSELIKQRKANKDYSRIA